MPAGRGRARRGAGRGRWSRVPCRARREMILAAAITNRVTKTVSGIDRDYAPVCRDLSEGWTLMARDELAEQPERLQLIGRRYTYIALLEDGQLLLIGARERRA